MMEQKLFSKAQKEMLERKVLGLNLAQQGLNEFVEYLQKEHEVDKSWQILKDLTGFEKSE